MDVSIDAYIITNHWYHKTIKKKKGKEITKSKILNDPYGIQKHNIKNIKVLRET